jgi:uncharacterized membrane protein
VFLVGQMVPVVIDVAEILGEFLPFGAAVNLLIALLGSVVVLVLLCFFAGLALLTGPGAALRHRVDGLLERIVPLYGAARRLAERVTGKEGDDFLPVSVDLTGTGTLSLGFLIENIPGGRCTVFIPMAPMAAFGNVMIVARERVERLDSTVPETAGVISEWGVGSARLFGREGGETSSEDAG